ncbi:MAG: hypothetical protein FIA93_11805 [Deltaproteobacteria bacterium]|nr:hypothetical protein [Deltaproteobacteria bacterium]
MRVRRLLLLSFLLLPRLSQAQDLSFLAGMTDSVDTGQSSYAWQIDLRYTFADPFALSASWINEGHFDDHHRDGFATRLWGRLPLIERRFVVAFGAGVYRYFDTQTRPGGSHANVHGWAPVYGLTGTWYTTTPWFALFGINHIHPAGDIDSTQYLLGAGYRFGKEPGDRMHASPAAPGSPPPKTTGLEVMPFLGMTVHNDLESRHGLAGGVEFRKGISRHFDGTLSWISEDNGEEIRRDGLGSQIWFVDAFLGRRLTLGVGAGLYAFYDRFRPAGGGGDPFDVAGLLSLTTSWRFSDRWFTRINWNRVATDNDRDSDIFVLGVGYRWVE